MDADADVAAVAATQPRPLTLESVADQATEARVMANNAWMLTSSALVLLMTAPGLAMFYGGLVRKKNVLGVIMQCVFLMGLNGVVWALWGYTLSFGGDGGDKTPWIGSLEFLWLREISPTWDAVRNAPMPAAMFTDADGKPLIPLMTHMLFQGMFFIITPALICGAFAERMKFSTMVVFSMLWGTLVYCPLCHGCGTMACWRFTRRGPSPAVRSILPAARWCISARASRPWYALLIGKRLGYGTEPMPPHNLTYTALGAAMLWFGWFGFNAGSALASDSLASTAFAATHFAAAAGVLAWAGMEWLQRGKPTVLGACSGAVAGLVCITPASGYVTPMPAIIMGLAAGMVCYFACTTLKRKMGYDDSLDAFGVHGVGGTLGALLTGVFATRSVSQPGPRQSRWDGSKGATCCSGQVVATALTWVYAAVVRLSCSRCSTARWACASPRATRWKGST